jgi:hypothetical protein
MLRVGAARVVRLTGDARLFGRGPTGRTSEGPLGTRLCGEIGGRMIGPDTETGCGRWLTPARRGARTVLTSGRFLYTVCRSTARSRIPATGRGLQSQET